MPKASFKGAGDGKVRVVHASWCADDLALGTTLVARLGEAMQAVDEDDGGTPISSDISVAPGLAGEQVDARSREAIAERLKDVTDLIVVFSPAYFNMQKACAADGELHWAMTTSRPREPDGPAIWLAVVAGNDDLAGYRLADMRLREFAGWHRLRDGRFDFPSESDMGRKALFQAEVDDAVRRLCSHTDAAACPVCKP